MSKTVERLGDGPVEQKYVDAMKDIARTIDEYFNGFPGGEKKTGFILMVFPFEDSKGELGRCNYMSNARREDVVILLKEQIARFEGQPEVSGRA